MENVGEVWHRTTAKRVGEAVYKRRKDAGMTAQRLAERCNELGVPIHRTTITKIENGRSRFDLGELLILAAALEVPPLVLLYPGLPGERVEIVPREVGTSWDAYRWATGMVTSLWDTSTPSAGAQLVEAVRELHTLTADLSRLQVRIAMQDDPDIRASLEMEVPRIKAKIARVIVVIRESGGSLNDD